MSKPEVCSNCGQRRGAQALADEFARCFLARAEKAEIERDKYRKALEDIQMETCDEYEVPNRRNIAQILEKALSAARAKPQGD